MVRRTAAGLPAVVAVVALMGGCGGPSTTESSPAPRTPPRHCPYVDNDLGKLAAFDTLVGRRHDCAVVFTDVTPTWAEWEHPWFLRRGNLDARHDWSSWVADEQGRRLVVTQSLVPSDVPDDWRRRGAAGEYDAHARAFAQAMVQNGLGDSIIRLAHEPNGTWYDHSVGETPEERRQWAQFWARTVRTMRQVEGARFEFDLTINAGVRPIPVSEYYPGDDVVDIIGVDQYDSWVATGPVPTGDDRWRVIRDQPGGLNELARFAADHGKPLSFPETGLVAKDTHGAGDDPTYVRNLAAFVREHQVVYVGYFDKNVKGTLRLEEVPESLKEWRSFAASDAPATPGADQGSH